MTPIEKSKIGHIFVQVADSILPTQHIEVFKYGDFDGKGLVPES